MPRTPWSIAALTLAAGAVLTVAAAPPATASTPRTAATEADPLLDLVRYGAATAFEVPSNLVGYTINVIAGP